MAGPCATGCSSEVSGGILDHKIIVCGGNGAGKSTLGRALAERLGYPFLDIESYYFPHRQTAYPYDKARTDEEAGALLLADMKALNRFVLAAVKGSYGKEVESLFTCAVLIQAPKALRLERVKQRTLDTFGKRALPGGDLYKKEKQFFDMVNQRSGQETEQWLKQMRLPVIAVDGTRPIPCLVESVVQQLDELDESDGKGRTADPIV